MDFGFTNDPEKIAAVRAWRDAAIADGWSAKPTYSSESIDRACTLNRGGFVASILTRERENKNHKWAFEADVNVWGPDGIACAVPTVYSWERLQVSLRKCLYCLREDVEVSRVGFAGRCCAECLLAQKKKQEYPGWTN